MQVIRPEVVGVVLIQRGWCQGSLLDAISAPKSWLTLSNHQENTQEGKETSSPIGSPGYWTSDRNVMHQAGKNSSRVFLMQRRLCSDGREEALIADATVHIQIEKVAFLTLTPQSGFKENDKITPRKFSEWLARRYNRPALPDTIVNAIQKPVVKAIDRLPTSDRLHSILDGIDEILFVPRNDSVPFLIDIIFIRDERSDAPQVNDEDAARLGDWIANVLQRGKEAELIHWEMLSRKEISVYDYSNAYELPLDYYTSWDESTEY